MEVQGKLKLTINSNVYEIEPVNMGNILDIESNKMTFSNNKYLEMVRSSNIKSVGLALTLVEIAASFSVLIPTFQQDLSGVKSIFQLTPKDLKPLVKEYNLVFVPWYENQLSGLLDLEDEIKG